MLATALGSVPLSMAAGRILGAPAASAAANAAPVRAPGRTSLTGLAVELRENPLGVDADRPRFGWRMESRDRGRRQSAYRILVASSDVRLSRGRADLWDSGKVTDSVAIPYGGKALPPSTRYHCTVRAWDEEDALPMRSTDGVAGWDGARWITMAGKKADSAGAPMLRRQVALKHRKIDSARLCISALGVYNAYLDGRRVEVPHGNRTTVELLTAGWTKL
ncbi:hypothetical protein [Streptomyces sp. NPDC006527]|uniref:glycoside hydrolase family 78 protein n=1 Tax=Streptomyces sp. NPDC006527 TaxID=3364749 RepID=UPI0036AFA10D